jgi:thioesterase domain-containing protein
MDLVQHLGPEQPVYALQAPDLHTVGQSQGGYTSIEHMAACYLDAIRVVQPHGPYYLGGHSWGGLVAFEMAQRLHRSGETTALLALFDTRLPRPASREKDDVTLLLDCARELALQSGKEVAAFSGEMYASATTESMASMFERLERAKLLPTGVTFRGIQHFIAGYRTREAQARAYMPRVHAGAITLFRADDVPDCTDLTYGWDALTSSRLTVHRVPGTHQTFLHPPHVTVVAKLLHDAVVRDAAPALRPVGRRV